MSKRKERLARLSSVGFFDIDGTLTEGYTIFSFTGFLAKRGFFCQENWTRMLKALDAYQKSDREEGAYYELATNWVDNFAQGIQGQKVKCVREQVEFFWEKALREEIDGYRIQTFAKALIAKVGCFCKIIAISGSPLEALDPLKMYLGFDELKASTFEEVNGIYTGRSILNLALRVNKSRVIDQYIEGGLCKARSFAFGDSLHDLPLLEAVDNPFVVGHNPSLCKIGRERKWTILNDSFDIITSVEKRLEMIFKKENQ